jgi:signal transduction histidine kinase
MTRHRFDPRSWPLAVRVPLLVAAFMVAVAVVISNVVLQRLASDQRAALHELTESYLDGLSTALLPSVIRRDIWETFDVIDRSRARYSAVKARDVVVTLADGSVLAASNPHMHPTGSKLPAALAVAFDGNQGLAIDEASGLAWIRRALSQEKIDLGSIVAEIDIRELLAVRHNVLITLVVVNALLTLLFGTIGYVVVRRMLRPIRILTEHVERIRDGTVQPIAEQHLKDQGTEFGRLLASFNSMARALREREAMEARLAKGERIALLGRLASGMAHEVNNTLGGMLNLVDTLRDHGHDRLVRQRSLELLKRGLTGISNVVRATLATYKASATPGRLMGRDLDDLQFLLQHETTRHSVRLAWRNALDHEIAVDASAVRQVVLNLLLNACAAAPQGSVLEFDAAIDRGRLLITIADDGPGLPPDVAVLLRNPDGAPPVPGDDVGLGVWTVCHLVSRHGGSITVSDNRGTGTKLTIAFPIGFEGGLDAVA